MNKRTTMELAKDIRTLLLTSCPRTFFREASEKKVYPYVVFDIRAYMERRMELEIDLWNVRRPGTDTAEKELNDLADTIEDQLDDLVLSKPLYIASFSTNNDMKNVPDENKDIKHINMSFNIIYQS